MVAPHRVLFVCLGNICRSPAAEAVFAHHAARTGIAVSVDSAGTGDWHVGDAPYPPMTDCGAKRGYDLTTLRARQFSVTDFDCFDLIIVMDRANQRDVERLRPRGCETPVRLFLEFADVGAPQDVPDPYFTDDFDAAFDLIEQASAGLLAKMKA